MKETLLNLEDLFAVFDPIALLYLLIAIGILGIAKILNDVTISYDLGEQLTKKDNRAVSVSFAGYMISVSLIIAAVMASPSTIETADSRWGFVLKDVGNTALWSAIGIVLLLASRVINDRVLLPSFSNKKEIETDQNVGVGAVQAGTYVATALILGGSLYGEDAMGFLPSLGLAVLYFVISQIAFLIFGLVYEKLTSYQLHKELESDNVAAGVAFGGNLVALGILVSKYLYTYDSLIGLLAWTVLGGLMLMVSRVAVDKVFLPGDLLDDEIEKDRNWGAALIEVVVAIGLAWVISATFI